MNKKKGLYGDLHRRGFNNPEKYITDLYQRGESGQAIVNILFNSHKIVTTSKTIQEWVRKAGCIRNKQQAKVNAIKTGRMVYVKKPKELLYKTTNISHKTRMTVLMRDNFKCLFCGTGPENGNVIELHHIKGKQSTPENLQTLCFRCHKGYHQVNNT